MNGLEIKKDTFEALDTDGRLLVLYDYITANHDLHAKTHKDLSDLKSCFEHRKRTDTAKSVTCASFFGFFGGIMAHLGESWLKR